MTVMLKKMKFVKFYAHILILTHFPKAMFIYE